jgi:hypothetical protein
MKKKRLNALIIYQREQWNIRRTIEDSLFCFQKYKSNIDFYYYCFDPDVDIINIVSKYDFDIIIFHSIFMCLRWQTMQVGWNKIIKKFKNKWENSLKVVLVQDEQYLTSRTREFIKQVGISIIFTLANKECADILYPSDVLKVKRIERVLTGYVDEDTLKKVKNIMKNEVIKRDIDVGYRADKTPYALGKQGRLKTEIVEVFNRELKKHPRLKADIKNTDGKTNTFFGLDWFRFMLSCRTMIGSLGGASVLDMDGRIRKLVERYSQKRPNCDYEEIEENVLLPFGKKIDYLAISPRCFETVMTRTCQILVEGDYENIFIPGIHYIELKRDYSNLDEVLELVKNHGYCKKMADRAYKDIIDSQKYTYKNYVKHVTNILNEEVKEINKRQHSLLLITINMLLHINKWLITAEKFVTK